MRSGAERPLRPMPHQANRQLANQLLVHYSQVPADQWSWPNFTPRELACPLTGQLYFKRSAIAKLQEARDRKGGPIRVNSAHRSRRHNAQVGGAPLSEHMTLAFDIHLDDLVSRVDMACLLHEVGFRSFGFYSNFIHVDERPGRMWFGSPTAKRVWMLDFEALGLRSPSEIRGYLQHVLGS